MHHQIRTVKSDKQACPETHNKKTTPYNRKNKKLNSAPTPKYPIFLKLILECNLILQIQSFLGRTRIRLQTNPDSTSGFEAVRFNFKLHAILSACALQKRLN